jgi:hypothetical protein
VDDAESQDTPIRPTTSKALKEELIEASEVGQAEHKRKALEAIATVPDPAAKKPKKVCLFFDAGSTSLTLT